jgi:FMN phosphatase YigB (HAD superfamily)
MTKAVIFDIDGTLANGEHRQHYLRSSPKNWEAFKAALHLDTPHVHVVESMKLYHGSGYTIILASARSEEERLRTVGWLYDHGIGRLWSHLLMRKDGDYRDDYIIKKEMLEEILYMGYEPHLVFDDRERVVNMWREAGIKCYQVEPGKF